jgi:hypothetical protein
MIDAEKDSPGWKIWVGAFIAAAAVRGAFLWFWFKHDLDKKFGADPYVELAKHWMGWLPNATELVLHCVSPGYAGWCALTFWFAGEPNLFWVRIGNLLFSAGTVILTGLYAQRIAGATAARITTLMMIFAPALIFFVPHLQSESFYLFWQMLFFIELKSFWEKPSTTRALAMGIFGGIVTLIRSVFLLALPFFIVGLFVQAKRWRKPVVLLFVLVAGWSLPVIARTASNWIFYKKFIPLTAQGGQDLYLGIGRYAEDRWMRTQELIEKTRVNGYGYDRWVDRDKYLRREAISYIKAHPAEYMLTVAIKFFRYWRPWPYPPYPTAARIALGLYYSVLFTFALFGLYCLRARMLELLPILGFFLALSITHSFLDTTLRYRIPLEPLLIVFASVGVSRFVFKKNG